MNSNEKTAKKIQKPKARMPTASDAPYVEMLEVVLYVLKAFDACRSLC